MSVDLVIENVSTSIFCEQVFIVIVDVDWPFLFANLSNQTILIDIQGHNKFSCRPFGHIIS